MLFLTPALQWVNTAAESQWKNSRRSNYKQQIYSGQPPQRAWSFVKAEQKKLRIHNTGVVFWVIYT